MKTIGLPSKFSNFIAAALIITGVTVFNVNAQKQGNNWYFGFNVAIDFNSGSPVSLSGSAMSTLEGCASISDDNGNLLFYSDGSTVYNKLNAVMPNGTGLLGGGSSTQSALIIPVPGSTTQYYLFTVPEVFGAAGMCYSIVDMSLAGGNGDVINKNTFLLGNVCEKLAATYHSNGTDVWVSVHTHLTNQFCSFLISAGGISAPVFSNTGSVYTANDYVGYLKFSPNGTKAAAALPGASSLDIMDFDRSTGMFSNSFTFTAPVAYFSYGVEFSSTGNTLYMTSDFSPADFYQFDMTAGTPASILGSATIIHSINTSGGALQLGPDGKIYYNIYTSSTLGAIEAPDSLGMLCNPNDNAVSLIAGSNGIGLPNYISNIYNSTFTYTNTCFGDTTAFIFSNTSGLLGVQWDFGDTASGVNNISFNNNPLHYFTAPGTYNVQAIAYHNTYNDTINMVITINAVPVISLGADTSFCTGSSYLLDAGSGFTSYLWQDGTTNSTLTATAGGTYVVTVSNGNCSANDTVMLTEIPCTVPVISFSSTDTSFCEKKCIDFFDLSTNNPTSWQWFFPGSDSLTSTLQNPSNICYNNYGSFDVTLIACNSNGCDTLLLPGFINEYQTPVITITQSNDTLFASPGVNYQWWEVGTGIISGATNNYFVPVQPGDYYVVVSDTIGCEGVSNTITITGLFDITTPEFPFTINPNPNNGSFTIHLKAAVSAFTIRIINVSGQVVESVSSYGLSQTFIPIDMQEFANGLYSIQMITDNKIVRQTFLKR